MAVPQLMAGKRRRHQHQRIGLRIEFAEKRDERSVQCTQPAALDPALEQHQQVVDTGQRTQLGKAGIVQRGGQQVVKRADHTNTPGRSCGTGLP